MVAQIIGKVKQPGSHYGAIVKGADIAQFVAVLFRLEPGGDMEKMRRLGINVYAVTLAVVASAEDIGDGAITKINVPVDL